MENNQDELRLTISVLQIQRNAAFDQHAQAAVLLNLAHKELEKTRAELQSAQARIAELENTQPVPMPVPDHPQPANGGLI